MDTHEPFSQQRWDELAQQWERDEISLEQLNGQMFVWIGELYKMLEVCQREQDGLSHALADADARLQGVEAALR